MPDRVFRRVGLPAVALAAVTGAVLLPGTAQAASGVTASGTTLQVTAQAGMANRISVTLVNATFTVTDTGDTVTPGTGCVTVDPKTVQCSAAGITRVVGNAGNDTLTGLAGVDNMFGNDGQDKFLGGEGNDNMEGDAGADVFHGGNGIDEVRYNDRTATVRADPDNVADDGETNEKDDIRFDVEDITGGDGSDTVSGSAVCNRLAGGAGDDTLLGLGDDDALFGDNGADRLHGGAGNDSLNATAATTRSPGMPARTACSAAPASTSSPVGPARSVAATTGRTSCPGASTSTPPSTSTTAGWA